MSYRVNSNISKRVQTLLLRLLLVAAILILLGCTGPRLCAPGPMSQTSRLLELRDEAAHSLVVAACWETR